LPDLDVSIRALFKIYLHRELPVTNTSSFGRRAQAILPTLLLFGYAAAAPGADIYDPATRQLNVRQLVIGNSTFSNVVLTPGQVLSLGGGAPDGRADTYNPALNQITIPAVSVGATTYTNVVATVANLQSIGSANWVDSYNSSSGQLRVAAAQVNGAGYNNVLVTVGTVIGVAGGMPSGSGDQYNPGSRQLAIPAVQVGKHIYTNALITLGSLVSLGAASRFNDAPVTGLCYGTSPSASSTDSATNVNGQFLYDTGDLVLFWVDGTGGGCTGTMSSAANSVPLGFSKPTGTQSSVLGLAGGREAAETLAALNVGSSALMDVSGLLLSSSDAASLAKFIKTEGAALPSSAGGSVDTFFSAVQADTVLASDSAAPAFAMPVPANASITTSVLADNVVADLLATFAALPGQPTSITVPTNGELKFTLATSRYTCPICAAASTVYTSATASFIYLDGQGHAIQIGNPGTDAITTSNLADKTLSGTYTISGNVVSKSLTGIAAPNGDTFSFTYGISEDYSDGKTSLGISSAPFVIRYTSGSFSGGVFSTGDTAVESIELTPMTLADLAGKTVTTPANGCPNNENVLTYVGVGAGPSSVTLTQSCGGALPVTLTSSAIPGLIAGTDTSGYIVYLGLLGSGLVAGAQFILIQESAGTLGSNGNGSPFQWDIGAPISSVN
jgi:hypothetical protein